MFHHLHLTLFHFRPSFIGIELVGIIQGRKYKHRRGDKIQGRKYKHYRRGIKR